MSSAPALASKAISASGLHPVRWRRHSEPETPQRVTVAPVLPLAINLGGAPVHLATSDDALGLIMARAAGQTGPPLAVGSANLDHIKHFGHGSKWAGAMESTEPVEWLTLLDGAPLVTQAERLTQIRWPRLAGSDLSWPILAAAAEADLRVGFIGGQSSTHELVRHRLNQELSKLDVAGYWAPERKDLADPDSSRVLAADISAARVDILFVCLGKPRQELWIKEYGHLTGANVLLAFGAAVDFLAGKVRRAPEPLREAGLEWAWRLALEPKRLASRYLVDGPPAYARLRSFSGVSAGSAVPSVGPVPGPSNPSVPTGIPQTCRNRFAARDEPAHVAVLIVTYNSEETLPLLVADLRKEAAEQTIKVIVADNSPSSATLHSLLGQEDVDIFRTGGNLGYAAGINLAMRRAGNVNSYLVLNPDIRLAQGCVAKMRTRMERSGAGVVVPLLKDDDGSVYPSLRREPTVTRAVGDAVLGSRIPGRPGWLSEMKLGPDNYARAHQVDWATGAALLIDSRVARTVGDWDEQYFLYSEETDFMRRVRQAGATIWYEPTARMSHSRGASGASSVLDALMAANRVRYIRKFKSESYARLFHGAVILSALLREPLPAHRGILAKVARESRWIDLPGPDSDLDPSLMPRGSVIIAARNGASVLARTLEHLAPYATAGRLEVVVVCSDGAAGIAQSYPGVQIVEPSEASKGTAISAADAVATIWPRLYLDADIDMHPTVLAALFSSLSAGGTLAARPGFVYNGRKAHWLVRSYYRARFRMPSQRAHLWAAGAFAVSAEGHSRIKSIPDLAADDLSIDSLFCPEENTVVASKTLVVSTPHTVMALEAVLRRTCPVNAGQNPGGDATGSLAEVLGTVRGLLTALDAAVYAIFTLRARTAGRMARSAACGGLEGQQQL
ncbi:WecB/TagA/CpsF family glycosyltransferase [Pseudarthrobacter sp. DSP2-3-2b1]|uniref:WecB/TagA/CpsF family glycosyltransferase n=1 Tax=Pseudarthrobacter sp. DSP2-3-2b1 TaxID=2804661 RepID=UPI003CEE7710